MTMMNRNLVTAIGAVLAAEAAKLEGGSPPADLTLARTAAEAEADDHSPEAIQARKARLAAAQANAIKQAADGTALPDEIVGYAINQMRECWKEFDGKDGVYDLTKRARAKLASISQHILGIAKKCAVAAYERSLGTPDADYVKLAGAMFRNAMAQAENSLRATIDFTDEEAEEKLDNFLTSSWNVYKSQVNSAMNAGMDPRDHDTIYKLNQAAKAAKELKNSGGQGKGRKEKETETTAQTADDGGEEATAADSADRTETETESDSLADYIVNIQYAKGHAATDLLLTTLGRIDWDKHEDQCVNIINLLVKELNKLTLPEREPEMGTVAIAQPEAVQA
jgi:hypothetical protein